MPVAADGSFRATIPQGRYLATYRDAHTSFVALAAGADSIDLRRGHAVTFAASSESAGSESVILRATVDGTGRHTFSVRADNLDLSDPESVSVDLANKGSRIVTWHARILDKSTPWVAVVLRDGSLDGHAELSGRGKSLNWCF